MKKTKTTEELIKDAPRKAPDGPMCPKCAQQKGWIGPTYRAGRTETLNVPIRPYAFQAVRVAFVECLIYHCLACGYERQESCSSSSSGEK